MWRLKYAALLPIAGEAGYGSYLLASTSWGQDSTTTRQLETPKEIPIGGGPVDSEGNPILEGDDDVLPQQALDHQKEQEEVSEPKETEVPTSAEETKVEPKEEAKVPAPAPSKPQADPVEAPKQEAGPISGEVDEMIEAAGEGSIGRQYKDSLIGTKRSTEWTGKVTSWKSENEDNNNDAPFTFTDLTDDKLKTQIMDRCQDAYKHKSFDETTVNGQAFNKEKYWAMVWSYCSKETAEQPTGWGGYN